VLSQSRALALRKLGFQLLVLGMQAANPKLSIHRPPVKGSID
jgi:hypothetical protein